MLPKRGRSVCLTVHRTCASEIASALKAELGSSHRAVKTLMRWTGASERSAKNWLAGTCAPSGANMILLLRESDFVARKILQLAGRSDLVRHIELDAARQDIESALAHIEAAISAGTEP